MEFKYELITTNDDLPFRMFIFEGKDGNYKVPKHWHRSIEIFLVIEGVIDFYINSTQHTLEKGQVILVNSNEIHSIEAPHKNFTLVFQIPRKLFENYVTEDELVFQSTLKERDHILVDTIKKMYSQYEKKENGYQFDVLSYFYKILYILMNQYKLKEVDEIRRKHNRQLEKLSTITQYIKEHYNEDISLESVAKVFGFNPTYLSKMFQKYAGINYKVYVMDVRMNRAYKELINTGDSITEIAIRNGFSDSRSFTKAFKKRFNTLPSVYRKEIQKTQESAIKKASLW